MQILLALIPIAIVLIGIVGLKIPAWIVALVASAATFVLALMGFSAELDPILQTSYSGIISALQVLFLVWGAFSLLETMKISTAMDRIKMTVGSLTTDKRAQVVTIAICLGVFIEGATGNGAAGAILGPFLVGLGFAPLEAAAAVLIANGVPPCFGGAGTPTVAGMGGITDKIDLQGIVAMTGNFLSLGLIIVPFVLVAVLFGSKALKGMWAYLVTIGITMAIAMFLVTHFMGPELPDLITGVVGLIVSACYIKFVGIKNGEEYASDSNMEYNTHLSTLRAFSPYILLLVMLPAVRFSFSLDQLTRYGYPTWIGAVIHICVLIGTIIMGCTSQFLKAEFSALKKLIVPGIALMGFFVLANIMNAAGMLSTIAGALAAVAGPVYPAVSVIIGILGAFITGSCLGSNRMFAALHLDVTQTLGIDPFVSIAGSSAGGSLGNMICPNNIIAVNATLELKKSESAVLARTIKACLAMTVCYCVLAMILTYVL